MPALHESNMHIEDNSNIMYVNNKEGRGDRGAVWRGCDGNRLLYIPWQFCVNV